MTTQAAQGAYINKRETSEASFAGTQINNHAPDFLALPQEAVQALPAAIYTTDAEGRITFYNEAAAALWGCRPELGPPVVALGKSSYGTSTIRDLIPYEFGGTVDLVRAPEGVQRRLELPAEWLGEDRQAYSETSAHHHREPEKLELGYGA